MARTDQRVHNAIELQGEFAAIVIRRRNGNVVRAWIDARDVEFVEDYAWSIINGNTPAPYVASRTKGKYVLLHRLLTNAPKGSDVDHINHDGLDCRRKNLRVVDRTTNLMNRRGPAKHSRLQARGVRLRRNKRAPDNYEARIRFRGKEKSLGRFATKEAAEAAYREALKPHRP